MIESTDPARRSVPDARDLSGRVRSLRLNNRDGARPPRSRFFPWIVSFVLLLTTVAFGYRAYRVGGAVRADEPNGQSAKADRGNAPAPAGNPAPAAAAAAPGEVILQSKGYIIPVSLVQVSPKVGGQLVWINENFKEGTKFTKGDVLAKIEHVEYKAEHDQTRANWEAARARHAELEKTMPEELAQALADLEESRHTATQLKLDLERNRRLGAGTVTLREIEQTKFSYEANQSRIRRLEATVRLIKDGKWQTRLDVARAEVDQTRALYERARARLDWTDIKAPVSGTILTKKAELGNIVNPSAFSSGISASLCDMADLTELEVDLSIQERDVSVLKKGQACYVMPEAYQADKGFLAKYPRGYEGFVSRLMPTADRAKGANPVRVKIKNIPDKEAGQYLRPDMGALVSFLQGPEPTSPDLLRTTRK